jgi:hypothetical protein
MKLITNRRDHDRQPYWNSTTGDFVYTIAPSPWTFNWTNEYLQAGLGISHEQLKELKVAVKKKFQLYCNGHPDALESNENGDKRTDRVTLIASNIILTDIMQPPKTRKKKKDPAFDAQWVSWSRNAKFALTGQCYDASRNATKSKLGRDARNPRCLLCGMIHAPLLLTITRLGKENFPPLSLKSFVVTQEGDPRGEADHSVFLEQVRKVTNFDDEVDRIECRGRWISDDEDLNFALRAHCVGKQVDFYIGMIHHPYPSAHANHLKVDIIAKPAIERAKKRKPNNGSSREGMEFLYPYQM